MSRVSRQAGVTWFMALDMMPFVATPDQLEATTRRAIEVCARAQRVRGQLLKFSGAPG